MSLERIRNIGIIAHIDAGKTTVTERFLYYAGLTHKIGEVHDGAAAMDFRSDERERGITISAAAGTFTWNNHQINLIDTPGHVDFTAEVERSLRVLDGAVVVFSGVEGVEPQSETVWLQADRYAMPRLAFINKLDRAGADHNRVFEQIESRLGARAAFVNLPHWTEDKLDGILDLLDLRWLLFDAASRGSEIESREIPVELSDAVQKARDRLVEKTANCVEWLADLYLAGAAIPAEVLKRAIREATVACKMVPVLCGAALRDMGVRPILDAVCDYLPSPLDRPPMKGINPDNGEPVERPMTLDAPFSALVFKVVATANTDFFWLRVYSGSLTPEDYCLHPRSKQRMRLRRLLRLQADQTETIERAACGDIVAVPGLKDVVTGDTVCAPNHPITFEPIHFPQTVVSMAVEARTPGDRDRLSGIISRLTREDPTLTVRSDIETGQLILSGMGELHLEITKDRMLREFNVAARFGRPRVSYRETVSGTATGEGDFAKRIGDTLVSGRAVIEVMPRPRPAGDRSLPPVEIDLKSIAAHLPVALQKEARTILLSSCNSGGPSGYPIVDVRIRVLKVSHNDPPDPSIPLAASLTLAMRHALAAARTLVLEPIMKLEVRVPSDCLGAVMRDLGARSAEIRETALPGDFALIHALVPLANMFGYSTQVRSLTQGRGSFSLEPYDYQPARSQS
jgi:elongation factor G